MQLFGTMDSFMKFVAELENGSNYLPVKRMTINTDPPADFPKGEKREVAEMHFRVTCSSFFMPPQLSAQENAKPAEGEAKAE